MPIVIAFLTALGGLVWALYRLQNSGLDLNAFNPFYWLHRRRWQQKLGTKPLHRLDNSMEVAALLLVAIAKAEGDLTREQKRHILALFQSEFKLTESDAQDLYVASCHLLKDAGDMVHEVPHILAPSIASFTTAQKASLLQLSNAIASGEGPATDAQIALCNAIEAELYPVAHTHDWTGSAS